VHQRWPAAQRWVDPGDDEGRRGDRAAHAEAGADALHQRGLARAERPGQDLLAQALFGLMAITGQQATGPRPVGVSIIDHHGASADLVTRYRIGTAVDPADTLALATALKATAADGPARDGYLSALAAARDRFTFESNMTGLRAFLAAGQHAPDIGTRQHTETVADLMARRPLLAGPPTPLL